MIKSVDTLINTSYIIGLRKQVIILLREIMKEEMEEKKLEQHYRLTFRCLRAINRFY